MKGKAGGFYHFGYRLGVVKIHTATSFRSRASGTPGFANTGIETLPGPPDTTGLPSVTTVNHAQATDLVVDDGT